MKTLIRQTVLSLAMLLVAQQALSAEVLVNTQKAYRDAVKAAEPGDTIVLANGTWKDFEMVFRGEGEEGRPITLTAEEKGKVFLTGQSNLRLGGNHLVVSGLVFKDGFTPSSSVIEFRRNKQHLANNSRVTEVVIDNYSNPERFESDYWVAMYGRNNRFDHNHLVGKRNKGVTMAVRLDSEASQENHHRIDHNYFGPRPMLGSNGGETLRIGTSHYSLTDSYTLVENNFFDRCDGEVEIISVKSGKNRILNNTFFESRGTLTLRHGNGNLVEGNVFFGNGVDHTGGIRVINRDQVIRNNYLEGLTGFRFGSGFTVMNGVPNSPINRYHRVVNADISHNSFINVDHIHLAAGSDDERSAVPLDSRFAGNLIFQEDKQSPFSVFDDISGIHFAGNVSSPLVGDGLDVNVQKGLDQQSVTLTRAENGLLYPDADAKASVGASRELSPVTRAQVGPAWYPKADPIVPFGSGDTVKVTWAEDALFDAAKAASAGDVLVLDDGIYTVRKTVSLNKTLTIRARNRGKVTLLPERGTLFEIADGGSLELDGLVLSGKQAPDSAGNSLIRTARWGMLENYRFAMRNTRVEHLDVNHSFHFFDSGSRAFATSFTVENSRFENISGDLIRLDKERDDLGIYNAEYVTLKGNEFRGVHGALVNLYRGGTDESTFGPHLEFSDNKVFSSGLGKRNKPAALLKLHGVQLARIENNHFEASQVIKVEHTVGEPKTRISSNQFHKTDLPEVVELRASGPHTAVLADNSVQ
ncbi:chondroitinase-B domain-containing protein [Biformimicrobium ophioploci]|nr:chondroitinase-B domain-containing protein [Microbulbifer sp. NKW57]